MSMPSSSLEEEQKHISEFRQFLPDLTSPRFTTLAHNDARGHARELLEKQAPPWLHGLYLHWQKLLQEPFKGITNDGIIRPGLFQVRDEGVPVSRIVAAAQDVINALTPEQKEKTMLHIDSPEWRTWSNPEFLLSDKGIRLDDIDIDIDEEQLQNPNPNPVVRDAVLRVLRETLSPEGYAKALGAMRINGFLGRLVGAPRVMNEHSYNFVIFGSPELVAVAAPNEEVILSKPWGFSFYGHHLCLSVFLYGTQIVISPWFTGAEPNIIDDDIQQQQQQDPDYTGTRILHVEERLGLQLMQSLDPEIRDRAQVYKLMRDPAMPKGRWNHDDQRHLCGAYRDNRVVPYEGVLVSSFTPAQRLLVEQILEQYLLYLPERARKMRLDDCRSYFDETYFCWIGGYGDDDPFYYRLQSPVIIAEFDHHSGVFLTNEEPAKFHVHTLLRTPNAGDYGWALRSQIEGVEQQDYVWQG